MARLKLALYGAPVLRQRTKPIAKINKRVRKLAADMLETMYVEDGVGLAAPQVGIGERLIVLDLQQNGKPDQPIVMVNPEILIREGEVMDEEGCLSIPDVRGEVKRAQVITVRAQGLDGRQTTLEAKGLLARIIQHEVDHLDGILFVDYLSAEERAGLQAQLDAIAEQVIKQSIPANTVEKS